MDTVREVYVEMNSDGEEKQKVEPTDEVDDYLVKQERKKLAEAEKKR